jgi:hypothetical protein
MPVVSRVIPWLVLGFALVALLLGIFEWLRPPFTDGQLRASLVDTWEVARSTTRVFMVVFLGLGSICLALAGRASETMARYVAIGAAAASLATLLLYLRNHIVLTQRAAALTGEDLGPFFGMF